MTMTYTTFQNLADASNYARKTKFAESTHSIGLAVMRNGRERVFHFNDRGNCIGWQIDDEVIPWSFPMTWEQMNNLAA